MNRKPVKRGDIYYANLDPVIGFEQDGTRPCLVVQNEMGNKHSPTTVIVPITRNLNKKPIPTHVTIPHISGLSADSLALVEQIRTIDRSRLCEYIGRINGVVQEKIDTALAVCVDIERNISQKAEVITLCLCSRCENNFLDSGYVVVKKGWQKIKEDCDFCKHRLGVTFGIFRST